MDGRFQPQYFMCLFEYEAQALCFRAFNLSYITFAGKVKRR